MGGCRRAGLIGHHLLYLAVALSSRTIVISPRLQCLLIFWHPFPDSQLTTITDTTTTTTTTSRSLHIFLWPSNLILLAFQQLTTITTQKDSDDKIVLAHDQVATNSKVCKKRRKCHHKVIFATKEVIFLDILG